MNIFVGPKANLSGANMFSFTVVVIWFVTPTILLFAFCYCNVKKICVCLLFTTAKTCNDRSCTNFA